MNRTIKPVTGRAGAEFLLKYSMYIVCIGFLIVPSIFFPGFGSLQSITVLLKNISMWGIMAIGVSFVMIIGCNDLSVGLNVSMITVIATMLGEKYDLGVIIPAVLVIGILTGAFNGLVVTKLRINPFIATLSTQMIFKGIAGTGGVSGDRFLCAEVYKVRSELVCTRWKPGSGGAVWNQHRSDYAAVLHYLRSVCCYQRYSCGILQYLR